MARFHWNINTPSQVATSYGDLPPLLINILQNRGIESPEDIDAFIVADERLASDPFTIPGMDQATHRIYKALLSGEKVAVYGDFDADGVTATAVMVLGLNQLGANVEPYIPHRINEGHGLKTTALKNLKDDGFDLVISVDCGITAVPEIEQANRIGLDIVVTDHHMPLDNLPPAVAVVNPSLKDGTYVFAELAGVGIAYKVLQALYATIGRPTNIEGLLDLVAIGTIADIVPLIGENRYLVRRGLELLNNEPRIGLQELINVSQLKHGNVQAGDVSWKLAPRLNVAGRMDHAFNSYRLLSTVSVSEARKLSAWLDNKNNERQKLTTSFYNKARDKILNIKLPYIIVYSDEDCPVGIAGLVASRLSEEFYRPAIVIGKNQNKAMGSCRSIAEFDITLALSKFKDLFTHFGGHHQAAGFVMPLSNIPTLTNCLQEYAQARLASSDLKPSIKIDAIINLGDIGPKLLQTIKSLEPFGEGNDQPIFLSRNVRVMSSTFAGANNKHARLKLCQGKSSWDSIAFNQAESIRQILPGELDVVYNLEINNWRGEDTLRLNILDTALSGET